MSPPWDVFGVGAAMGGAAGLFAGYQVRKLVVRFQEYRANRYVKVSKKYAELQRQAVDTGEPVITARQKPALIPMARSKRHTPANAGSEIHGWAPNPDRDEVIEALMGAGYKKTAAVKAADACSPVERASGLAQWIMAALRNAAGEKQ